MSYDVRKREARRRLMELRKSLGEERRAEDDAALQGNVCGLPEFVDAQVILTYLDFGAEVRTRGIIRAAWEAGKVVALPWCVPDSREVRWFRVTSFDALVRNRLGMDEPVPRKRDEQELEGGERMIALVPGLTFDGHGFRLGYGGGFYDTFLARFEGVSVGLCRDAQMSRDLRAEGLLDAHDLPVQIVVTNSKVVRPSITI